MTTQTPPPVQESDIVLKRFREFFTAILALSFIVLAIIIVVTAMQYVDGPAEDFTRIKDILIFVNPFIGVVLGYYFTKLSTEGRAEAAEGAVRTATFTAQQATLERASAVQRAEQAEQKVDQAKEVLTEMGDAVERMNQPATGGTLSEEVLTADTDARQDLIYAWKKAQKFLSE
jgi:hypothetical protein